MRTPLNLYELIDAQAKRSPAAHAIASPGRKSLSYGRLHGHMEYVRQALNALGVGPNDRVAIVLPNGPEMAVAFITVAAAATAAPLNPAYRTAEFEFYLTDLRAKALIVQAGSDSPAIAVARSRQIPIIELHPLLDEAAGLFTLQPPEGCCPIIGAIAQAEHVALVLHTSGTTSKPKIVPLAHNNICVSAANIQFTLDLTQVDRCLNVMPLFHIHGLIGAVLSSLAAGAMVICPPGLSFPGFFAWMDEFRPTWYTAAPTLHQAILAEAEKHREIVARCPLRFVRSSSSALPSKVMTGLESILKVPVIETYGMTEAAHQIASNPLPPCKRKVGSVGLPAGPAVAILDAAGNQLKTGEIGEIAIHGANVTRGYENNPDANSRAFAGRWFRTGDQGYLDSDGYIFITGRIKEIINRGGEKIAPREVDEALLEHPAVAQAVTFAMLHPSLGEDVAAAIVLREPGAVDERELQRFAAERLARFKVPRQIFIVDEIPKGPTGKVQRVSLAKMLGAGRSNDETGNQRKTPYAAPRNPTEKVLTNLWAKYFGLKRVGIHDKFFDLGGDSLLASRLFAEIERVFDKKLPLGIIFEAGTVAELANALQRNEWSSLVAIQTGGSKLPIFCVHAAPGDILFYRDLVRHLGPDQPFYGLQAQALTDRGLPSVRIEDMAANYIKEIRQVQPTGPYVLGGYSLGAALVYEMARQLKRQSQEVAPLIFLDPTAPDNWHFGSPASAAQNGSARIPHFISEITRHRDHLSRLPLRQKMSYIGDRVLDNFTNSLVALNHAVKMTGFKIAFGCGIPLSSSMTRYYVSEVHRRAVQNYVPQVYEGNVLLFRAKESTQKWQAAWSSVIAGNLEIHEVPGNHGNFLSEPNIQLWAKHLKEHLDAIQLAFIAEHPGLTAIVSTVVSSS